MIAMLIDESVKSALVTCLRNNSDCTMVHFSHQFFNSLSIRLVQINRSSDMYALSYKLESK